MDFLRLLNSFCVTPKKESQMDQIQQRKTKWHSPKIIEMRVKKNKEFSFLDELFLEVCSGWDGLFWMKCDEPKPSKKPFFFPSVLLHAIYFIHCKVKPWHLSCVWWWMSLPLSWTHARFCPDCVWCFCQLLGRPVLTHPSLSGFKESQGYWWTTSCNKKKNKNILSLHMIDGKLPSLKCINPQRPAWL